MATRNRLTVPASYVLHLLTQVREHGYDVDEVLSHIGSSLTEIETQAEFPAEKFGQLYQRVMYVAQDEYFGMLSGGKVPNGTFRMMCHAILSCRNLGHAMTRISDFHEIVRGPKIKPKLEIRGRFASVSFGEVDTVSKEEFRQLLATESPGRICTSLSMWHHFISWLIGERVVLQAVHFSFPKSVTLPGCQTKFQAKLRFDQADNAFLFPTRYLEYPVVQTEKTLHAFLKTAPYQLLVMIDDENSLKAQVSALLGRDFRLAVPNASRVAELLNISVSTLRRRLQEEGTTFQQIKDECRKEVALNYMNSPHLSINDVVELMGFDEASVFFRSFKRWTGMTPGQYRAGQQFTHPSLNAITEPAR